MTQRRRRPNLAEFATQTSEHQQSASSEATTERPPTPQTTNTVHKSVYLPPEVADQLDLLALQERPAPGRRKKFNTLVLEALDLLLKSRGLPSIEELTQEKRD